MGKGVGLRTAAILALGLAGCDLTPTPAFDPTEIQRLDRIESSDVKEAPMHALPTTMAYPYESGTPAGATQPTTQSGPPATGPNIGPGQGLRLSLREILQRAAVNSAEVRVSGYDPAIAETRVIENEAKYDPSFIFNPKYDKQNDRTPGTVIPNPNGSQFNNILINVENNNIYTLEAGVKQQLASGAQVELTYQLVQSDYFPVRYTRNNYWDNELKFQIDQPLLQGFGYEVNWARVTIARNDQRVSVLDFRKTLEDNTSELEKDYWQLYEAQQEVKVQEQSLERATALGQILWRQFLVGGQATHVEVSQGAVEVENREAALLSAKARVQDISDDIKRRMNDPSLPVAGPIVVLPADDPVLEKVQFDLHDQIDAAMENRLELGQQQIRINSAEVAKAVALNGLYPKLDLVATATLQGLAGSSGGALNDQFGTGHMVYSLGFQLEVPIGNREGRAVYTRSQLQQLQAMTEYARIVAQVSEDVTQATREVSTDWNLIQANRSARLLGEDALAGLVQRREGGALQLTPEVVQVELDAQERLAESQRQEALAIANYNIALSKLEKAKGTLLRYSNIVLEEERFPLNLPHGRSRR